ncbi:unnamed protein product [Urochloa humidicola]
MAAVRSGVSSRGSTNTRKSDPTAGSCVSPGSPRPRSKASRAAAYYAADTKPTPEVEASAEKNRKTLLEISSAVGHSGRYGSHLAPSDGAGSLTHHRSASPSPCTRRGDGYREPHGGNEASSSFTRRQEKRQGRLPTRADFMKPSSTLENIRLQATRHPSLLDRRVEGANQVPPRSIHKAAPARLMHQAPSHNCRQHVDAIHAISHNIFTKVSKEEDKVDEQDWQTGTISTRTSSARDWNLESDGAFEGRKHSVHSVRPSAMPRNIRLQIPMHHSLLDRRVDRINQVPLVCRDCSSDNYHRDLSTFDASDEWRLHKGRAVTTKCLRQSSSTASKSSKSAPDLLGKVKDKVATVRSASAHTSGGTVGARKKEAYITTLGAGGGYGDPHPPPFYKCEVCCKGTAFYRLKCCRLGVCEGCGCACEPAEAVEDDKLQSQRGKVLSVKEKLPKVKLEGTDLFLWQPCSFPAKLMLCMAKRSGNHLQYYFAPVDDLLNPAVKLIKATVYTFRQHGCTAKSLSVRDELLTREKLR